MSTFDISSITKGIESWTHLMGNGFAGKPVYVKIMPCDQKQMNVVEKSLIKAFNAASSYNRTAGGSKRR